MRDLGRGSESTFPFKEQTHESMCMFNLGFVDLHKRACSDT